ncbi:serine O-acetyltransferase [Xanthobacter autotrophicus]|uniref:serine O-acetyltransferase n=1 Tax=Xanthobacter autotrophicus TaxID=280 RepID=UPI003727AD9E
MQAIVRLYRWSHALYGTKWHLASRAIDSISRMLFAASVPGRATIGRNVFFHHSGLGVVINGASVIEDDCEIGVHVVLGGRAPVVGAPHLGKGVIVHAGAKIIGPIHIGEGSVVAANATVISDMPPNSLITGTPATVKRTGISIKDYRKDVDSQLMDGNAA